MDHQKENEDKAGERKERRSREPGDTCDRRSRVTPSQESLQGGAQELACDCAEDRHWSDRREGASGGAVTIQKKEIEFVPKEGKVLSFRDLRKMHEGLKERGRLKGSQKDIFSGSSGNSAID